MLPTDRYRVASVTKPLVSTIVLELVAEGRLALTDTVERRLPGLVPNGGSITIRQLLNHTSGLYDYGSDLKWQDARLNDPRREWTPRELVAIAVSHPPLFAPGRGWYYSNTNYILAGLIVEAVTGKPLGQELRDRLVTPFALRATTYPTGTAIEGRHAHGYVGRGSGLPIAKGTLVDVTSILSPSAWGAGQVVSNADDLSRFFQALLRGRVLTAAQLRAMKTVVPGYAYGLGIRRASTACGTAWGHNGDIPGYRNVVWATADGRRAAAVMVNVDTTHVSWDRLEIAAQTILCSG
jgi:D-alanyl-D-alanine carboxypeptidase